MTTIRYQAIQPSYIPQFGVTGVRRATARDRARRGLNVMAAAVGIVLSAPLLLLIALAVRWSSPGPVLYRQTRVGVDRRSRRSGRGVSRRGVDVGGKPFTIYKFRTMYSRGSSAEAQVWARPDDPRITPIGGLLRKYRLDELPQLFNVLRGDMNLVGPRPEQPEIFAHLRQRVRRYDERQQVLPGITGWAQVRHRYDTSIEDVRRKVELDLEYIDRCSAAEDAKIMLMTVPVMVFKRGAV